MRVVLSLAAVMAGACASSAAPASGGPYVVDDADVIDPGTCAVEAVHSHHGSGTAISSLLPVCHVGGLAWTLGLTRARIDDAREDGVGLSAKYPLRPVSTGSWGIAIDAGLGRAVSSSGLVEAHANLPMTWEPVEALRLHANLGTAYARDGGQWSTTWGVGFDWALASRLNLLGERFGDDRGMSGHQLGLRPAVVADRVFVDIAWARGLEDVSGSWWTLGLVVEF